MQNIDLSSISDLDIGANDTREHVIALSSDLKHKREIQSPNMQMVLLQKNRNAAVLDEQHCMPDKLAEAFSGTYFMLYLFVYSL